MGSMQGLINLYYRGWLFSHYTGGFLGYYDALVVVLDFGNPPFPTLRPIFVTSPFVLHGTKILNILFSEMTSHPACGEGVHKARDYLE